MDPQLQAHAEEPFQDNLESYVPSGLRIVLRRGARVQIPWTLLEPVRSDQLETARCEHCQAVLTRAPLLVHSQRVSRVFQHIAAFAEAVHLS